MSMLKKRHRLTAHVFAHYFQSGKRFHGQYVTVIFTPTEQFHGAVVVGKKVSTRAVLRNRLRRRLYGILYQQRHTLAGVVLVLVKPAAKAVQYPLVRDDLRHQLLKLPVNQVQ
jgi:ribonuclease P protein component